MPPRNLRWSQYPKPLNSRVQLSATPSRRGFGKGPYCPSIIDPFGKGAATLSQAAASNQEVPDG